MITFKNVIFHDGFRFKETLGRHQIKKWMMQSMSIPRAYTPCCDEESVKIFFTLHLSLNKRTMSFLLLMYIGYDNIFFLSTNFVACSSSKVHRNMSNILEIGHGCLAANTIKIYVIFIV